MPIQPPSIDDRRYQDFLSEVLARIPAHTPEWTNHSDADPGVVLLQLFSFMAESVAYQTTFVPERTRRSFLSLLGRPIRAGAPARGIVSISKVWHQPSVSTVAKGTRIEGRGGVSFYLEQGVRVLPVEANVYVKTRVNPGTLSAQARKHYQDYYRANTIEADADGITLYRTTAGAGEIDLSTTVDQAIYLALLAPPGLGVAEVRRAIAGEILCVGLVPAPTGAWKEAGSPGPGAVEISLFGGERWQVLRAASGDLTRTGVIQVELPSLPEPSPEAPEPTAAGVGDLPPDPGDADVEGRLVTWLRLRPVIRTDVRVAWVGIHAGLVTQGQKINREPLGAANGEVDQRYRLAHPPVAEGSLQVEVRDEKGSVVIWPLVEDLYLAGQEGAPEGQACQVDLATGELRFGDGLHGARPRGTILASYTHHDGDSGNQGTGELKSMGGDLKVSNPVPTWGGTPAESLVQAEKSVCTWLQNRDRLVTAEDFETLARATPAASLARVDVVPGYHPARGATDAGAAPGVVTVLVLSPYRSDLRLAPTPDDRLLESVCSWLSPRRLVTTELVVTGPRWVRLSVRVAVEVSDGDRATAVASARTAILNFLSAQPAEGNERGWPLGRSLKATEIAAAASRAPSVSGIRSIALFQVMDNREIVEVSEIPLRGIELPWVEAVDVTDGQTTLASPAPTRALPVPIIPDECN